MKIPIIALCCLIAFIITTPVVDAKRKKNKSSSSPSAKSKTKTKWSTTMDSSPDGVNQMIATEEHGYYVKRTFVAPDGTVRTNINKNITSKSVPYLAIPIAWFPCPEGLACRNGISAISNAGVNALSEGFLCDDDCIEPYEPVCGRTPTEIAVFYNKCKLNVAKCRTHGYWIEFPIEECRKAYPKELEYTDNKFKNSPYFKSKGKENIETIEQALESIPSSSEATLAINQKEQQPEIGAQINKTQ